MMCNGINNKKNRIKVYPSVMSVVTTIIFACLLFACSGGGSSNENESEESIPNSAPQASAGPDQAVAGNADVELDASGSSDPDSDPLSYQWTQISGWVVTLDDSTTSKPTFTAPDVSTCETFVFSLLVNDGELDSETRDEVNIVVSPNILEGMSLAHSATVDAVSDGAFTFNNYWAQAQLNAQDIAASITYLGKDPASPDTWIRPYRTLASEYQVKLERCRQDNAKDADNGKCYPDNVPAAIAFNGRYGYYCGAGHPDGGNTTFAEGMPEPLDGVDYCCRLHDRTSWGPPNIDFHPFATEYSDFNECGIVMCLDQVMLSGNMTVLPSRVAAARTYWYQGAALICGGNQYNDPQAPVIIN